MNAFNYFMPTKLFFGVNCISENKNVFNDYGSKAMIFTGKSSAKMNGSLNDIISVLEDLSKEYIIFDEVEENPSLETVAKSAEIGIKEGVDFVIGIGGGSPMDTAKAASCLIANPDKKSSDLFVADILSHIPLIEIPTTAGTGSETTPYSVVTLHGQKTKSSIAQKVFAEAAFLDAKYMNTLSVKVTANTAVDALTHLIEGYMNKKANFMSDLLAESGFKTFSECISDLRAKEYTLETREKLLMASTIAGMEIAQSGTSLPHAMGYLPTYAKDIPHGQINGVLTKAYLELFGENEKVNRLLYLLGFKSLEELGDFLYDVLGETEKFTLEEINRYSDIVIKNKAKLSSHPLPLTREDIFQVYKKSLL